MMGNMLHSSKLRLGIHKSQEHFVSLCKVQGRSFNACFGFVGNVWQEMEDLLFDNYASSPPMMRLTNTGYGLRLDIGHCHCDSRIPTLSQGNLNGTFRFYQAHFHWGSSRSHGSEHMKSGLYEVNLK